MKAPTLTLEQAADALDVAPARVRALLAAGVLTTLEDDAVLASEVADLVERAALRTQTLADVEAALEALLERRVPTLLDRTITPALAPLSGEVALALADVEASTRELLEAQEATRLAQAQLAAAEQRIGQLETQVAVLQQPVGLFRRRRSVVLPA
ncbi:MAG: hypothetical protein M3P93_12180 [Actinomycetota bacterium]|nr:hypothetical protein [Actinomycetota bacterium]